MLDCCNHKIDKLGGELTYGQYELSRKNNSYATTSTTTTVFTATIMSKRRLKFSQMLVSKNCKQLYIL